MAQLHVMGDYEGPNERELAEYLARSLPADWHVLPNRKLDTSARDDVDIIVLAPYKVFVIEEKSWGPTVVVGDQRWTVVKNNGKSDMRSNPLSSANAKARKLASWLRDKVPGYALLKGRHVIANVALTHPNLVLKARQDYQIPLQISPKDSLLRLLEAQNDEQQDVQLLELGGHTLKKLLDLDELSDEYAQIGRFEVESEIEQGAGTRTFAAEHLDTGEKAILTCYDLLYWSPENPVAKASMEREIRTLIRIADLNRSWRYYPAFEFEPKNWFVVPLIKPAGAVSLGALISEGDSPSGEYHERFLEICLDAFQALAEIHESDVLHKGITPERVWIAKGMRVLFSDFNLSHLGGDESVYEVLQDIQGMEYRAPESKNSVLLATEASDVYSLALALSCWLTQEREPSQAVDKLLKSKSQLTEVLLRCLADDDQIRITASQAEAEISGFLQAKDENQEDGFVAQRFDVGQVINGRYEILNHLGDGGMAKTWLVSDKSENGTWRVLKQIHTKKYFDSAIREYTNAKAIQHVNCARMLEISSVPEPGFLIYEYFEGETLKVASQSQNFTLENIRRVCAHGLDVLTYIHSKNLVHGDISPRNIIISSSWDPKFIDFGLVAQVGDSQVAGTRATMPPEVARGDSLRPQSDIYSFAASLFISMLGRPPYAGDPNIVAGRKFEPLSLTELEREQWGDDGVAFINVLLQALSPAVEMRPSSAEEFKHLISQARPVPAEKLPAVDSEYRINEVVANLRGLYVSSSSGSEGSLGLSNDFARETYIPSRLDTVLLPDILSGKLNAVFLTGNPGDGKTSFLQQVLDELRKAGAKGEENHFGWELKLGDRVFKAVYDASEASEDATSDELVLAALSPSTLGYQTSLFAINDGRLRQFFTDFASDFPDYERAVTSFFSGRDFDTPGFAIVDLKARALVKADGTGLAQDMIKKISNFDEWNQCGSCAAFARCPIVTNIQFLKDKPTSRINDLLLISHLRRQKRATLRQVRSTLAWVITGDLGCEDVHEAVKNNVDLLEERNFGIQDLAFSELTNDPLVREWRDVDPSNLITPLLQQAIDKMPDSEDDLFWTESKYASYARKEFFGISKLLPSSQGEELDTYRSLDLFKSLVGSTQLEEGLDVLLKGFSSIMGSVGADRPGLSVSRSRLGDSWSTAKVIPRERFHLVSLNQADQYLEFQADGLMLTHDDGEHMRIDLDSFEIAYRASRGELFSDSKSEATRFEVKAFSRKLSQKVSDRVLIIDPAGESTEVEQDKGLIRLVRGTGERHE